jgi:hypothetical protein
MNEIWFTRCPVPTATGLAYKLGWLSEEFAADGIRIAAIQEAPRELSRHHYDHEIPTLIRRAAAQSRVGCPVELTLRMREGSTAAEVSDWTCGTWPEPMEIVEFCEAAGC